jgi:hypothetical protein
MSLSILNIYKSQIKLDLELITTFIESTYIQNEKNLDEIDKRFNAYYNTIEKDDQLLSYLEDKSYLHNALFKKHLFNSYFSILTAFFEISLTQIINFNFELNPLDKDPIYKGKFRMEEVEGALRKTKKINLADLKEDKDIILYYRDLRHLLVHCDSNLNFANKTSKNLISRIRKDKKITIDKHTDEIGFQDLSSVIEYKSSIDRFLNSVLDKIR